jgi:hypothetical protein
VNFFLPFFSGAGEQGRGVGVSRKWRVVSFLPQVNHDMSLILPISFLTTLLCVLVAIDWALYQQILFVGAALSATVWVCSFEAWSTQAAPMSEDQRSRLYSADE